MAKSDYIVNWEEATVTKHDEKLATFNTATKEVLEYFNGGDKAKRWIKEAINEAPEAAKPVDDKKIKWSDVENIRYGRINLYAHFPNAPKPKENKLNFDHPEIYDWFKENHSDFVEVLYPNGRFNAIQAAQKGLKTVTSKGVNIGPQ